MDMPDTLGGLVLAFALESEQPGVRADVRRLVTGAAPKPRLDVQSRSLVIRLSASGRGTNYGPGSPRQRHHDGGGASRDTAEPREREGASPDYS